jgi:hypothetical protein
LQKLIKRGLCHNVIGPHNQQFHALWNQLRDEHEELALKGYTGEGFLSQGKRLGGQRIPLDEARRQARAAAEQRRILTKNSGKKLGGTRHLRGTDIRKLRADAAQQRLEVTQGCASGTDHSTELADEASRNGFRTQAEEDDANERAIMEAFIELIQEEEREKYDSSYVPPSQENPAGPRTQSSPPASSNTPSATSKPQPVIPRTSRSGKDEPVNLTADNSSYDTPWICPTCTLENQSTFLCCDVCAAERPPPTNSKTTSMSTSRSASTQPLQSKFLNPKKRPLPAEKKEEKEANPRDTFAFKNRTRPLDSIRALDRGTEKKPLGWLCTSCGSFMETHWWTCSCCGTMKPSS